MSEFLVRNSGRIILAAVVLTLLLVIPLLTMEREEQASSDPPGEVLELKNDVNDRFAPEVHTTTYIVESRTGDILTQAGLWELYQAERRLREADQRGTLAPEGLPAQPYLYEAFDVEANRPFVGVHSLADAVQEVLLRNPPYATTLETATDAQVKLAVHQLLSNPETSGLRKSLSIEARSENRVLGIHEIDYWTSPALVFNVLADNERLGGGTLEIAVGGDETVLDKEEFNRNMQRVLRGDERSYRLWGIVIDINLEAADEGQTAGPFIMFTVVAVVLIAGLSLRSYWAVALTGAGLASLMIWLKGISNLVGLKGGLIIELIVPIAMISLGVDFALHGLRRYREEKGHGYAPGMALRAGFAGLLGALILAMASDSIAFLANASSGIEEVIHFSIAASIAIVSSFIVLGVVLPLAMMRIDQLRPRASATPSRKQRFTTLLNSMGVAALTGASVIMVVAVSKPLGVLILFGMVAGFLVAPLLVMRRRQSLEAAVRVSPEAEATTLSRSADGGTYVALVAGIARYRYVLLPVFLAITVAAALFATKLEATLDVRDYFVGDSDFVVSLDKLDEHQGETNGVHLGSRGQHQRREARRWRSKHGLTNGYRPAEAHNGERIRGWSRRRSHWCANQRQRRRRPPGLRGSDRGCLCLHAGRRRAPGREHPCVYHRPDSGGALS
jgi:hypothetical protein